MQFDPSRPVLAACARFGKLERDWQSVTIGAMIVGVIAVFEIPVPW